MSKKFGTTWWGEQWLNALTHIDYSNRLPRGARYARNGSVRSIEINNGVITARVAGSRPSPYKITIKIPQFTKKESAELVAALAEQPLILAELMQRRLDPQVLDIAKGLGLKVFPASWRDFDMKCSCPDWAVPCKHLAAVIYKLSEEIDNNPFLVFSLHGLDLMKEFQDKGIVSEHSADQLEPPSLDSLLEKTKENRGEWQPVQADFSRIPDLGNDLAALLVDNPPFGESGNYKELFNRTLNSVAKAVAKMLTLPDHESMRMFNPSTFISFELTTDGSTNAVLAEAGKDIQKIPFAEFVDRLAQVVPSAYLTSEPWVETLHRMWLFALNLVAHRAVIPKIVKMAGNYRILWMPATLHPDIKQMTTKITRDVATCVKISANDWVANSGEWILWNMLTEIISQTGRKHIHNFDPVHSLFFANIAADFTGIGEKGIPGAIKAWTDKFFLLADSNELMLKVSEAKNWFEVALELKESRENGALGQTMPFSDIFMSSTLNDEILKTLTKVASLADYMPKLKEYLAKKGSSPMIFSPQEFPDFLFKTIPFIRLLGVEVALPKSLRHLIRPMVTGNVGVKEAADAKSYLRLDELLTFDWAIALGDIFVHPDEFNKMLLRAGELVKFKGQYIYVTPEELEKIQRELAKGEKLTPQEILAIALSEHYNDSPIVMSDECRELIENFRRMESLPVPTNLNATLRPYQKRGYEWMVHNLGLGFGSIIADDMGLGKTLQVIAVLLHLQQTGRLDKKRALVVVPTGLITNWKLECERFAPSLSVGIYHGASRDLKSINSQVLITSYGIVRSDVSKLKKLKWEIVIIDEAQNIKNTATAQTKAVVSINASSYIAMSGTPVENNLSEYWSIMNFANKGLLGSLKSFNTKFAKPIQIEGDISVAERFKAITAPFMLRRLKSDKSIISDLPDKIERDVFAALTPEQSALYQQTLDEAMAEIEGLKAKDHQSLFKREGLVLQMIMALKQICNHPSQFLKAHQADASLSGKGELLLELVKNIVNNGEKVLIFTQFREMGDILAEMLAKEDIPSMFLHGGCSVKKRAEMVARFQQVRSAQVFILSLKAAGTGLNLTAATNVIHYDLWWNPAVEAQATDRAYRIGQHSNVQVFRFITSGTFEERINEMIQDKKKLADLTVSSGEKWISKLSDSELRQIFSIAK